MKTAIVSNRLPTESVADFVDSCDRVVRFSVAEGFMGVTGSKITHWVTRAWAHHAEHIEAVERERLSLAARSAKHAFVVHNFEDHLAPGQFVGFSTTVLERLVPGYAQGLIGTIPIDAKAVSLLHPNNKPTNGIILLHHLLTYNVWPGNEIYLVGFEPEGNDIDAHHNPDWELGHIDKWVQQGYFTYHTLQNKGISNETMANRTVSGMPVTSWHDSILTNQCARQD